MQRSKTLTLCSGYWQRTIEQGFKSLLRGLSQKFKWNRRVVRDYAMMLVDNRGGAGRRLITMSPARRSRSAEPGGLLPGRELTLGYLSAVTTPACRIALAQADARGRPRTRRHSLTRNYAGEYAEARRSAGSQIIRGPLP